LRHNGKLRGGDLSGVVISDSLEDNRSILGLRKSSDSELRILMMRSAKATGYLDLRSSSEEKISTLQASRVEGRGIEP